MSFAFSVPAALQTIEAIRRRNALREGLEGDVMEDGGKGTSTLPPPPEVLISDGAVGTPAGTPAGQLPASAQAKNNTMLYVALGVAAIVVAVVVLRRMKG